MFPERSLSDSAVKLAAAPPPLTEDAIRAAFSPAQAEILLALVSTQQAGEYLSMKEAAEFVGWTYSTFRKEPAFFAANVAPQGRRQRFRRSVLVRVAENLRQGSR